MVGERVVSRFWAISASHTRPHCARKYCSEIVSDRNFLFNVESAAIGVLESAAPNTELWAKPHLAWNTPHSKSVNLLSPPKIPVETIPLLACRNERFSPTRKKPFHAERGVKWFFDKAGHQPGRGNTRIHIISRETAIPGDVNTWVISSLGWISVFARPPSLTKLRNSERNTSLAASLCCVRRAAAASSAKKA